MATPIPRNEARFSLGDVARLTGGTLRGDDRETTHVVTDSRAVGDGALFVALKGERFDAHAFLGDVFSRGAIGAVVRDPAAIPSGSSVVVVDNTLAALGSLGRAHRRGFGGRVVGITGSAGKTTTKELVRAALTTSGDVHATEGNLNNRVGVPMTLFGLAKQAFAVVEMGTSERGEIAALTAMVEPDVALITSIGLSHAQGIGSEADVAVEKGALFRGLGAGAIAVVLVDDPRIAASVREGQRTITYGRSAAADVRLIEARLSDGGLDAALRVGGSDYALRLGIPSLAAAVNAAGALATAIALGVPVERALAGLTSAQGVDGRMRPVAAADGVTILDDTYNANPRSVAAALESASALASPAGRRLVAVLGDMKELGDHEEAAHAEVGRLAVRAGVARFVAVGRAMRAAGAEAERSGIEVAYAEDAGAAAGLAAVNAGDLVLVKGSRSMRMERVVEALAQGRATP